ncbi:GatB/YqeY domain-containing protein [Mesorhizobium sp. PUT5]|uniref:GatB/YqeY domain-containing protein n=1 Tax=Mesorhizobium sp. PUT5 TaxID=3454629 RepID=UPI003FA4409D
MRDRIAAEVKTAMKAGEKARLSTLRLVQAAVKDRDIANRGGGKEAASDDDIVQLLAKMVKQREESAKAFDDGSRPELADKEREEIAVIREFLPRQMDEAEAQAAIRAAIAETGAAGIKDMGKVMAALRDKYAGQMDFGRASAQVKAALS